jgi:hypothetical protein
VCRGEIPKEGHETKRCVISVEKAVCVNVARDQKSPVRERQVKVDWARGVQKVSYVEAVKRVVEEDGSRASDPKRFPESKRRPMESNRNDMYFSKIGFFSVHSHWLSTVLQKWNVNHRI